MPKIDFKQSRHNYENHIMKTLKIKKFRLFLITMMTIVLFGCPEIIPNDGLDNQSEPETKVVIINTTDYGEISTSSGEGIKTVPGTVPKNENGENANVSFSIETHIDEPKRLNPGATFKMPLVKFGPENFNFAWPVQLSLPYPLEMNPDDLSVMYYDEIEENWQIIPKSSIDTENRLILFNSLNLGIFGLAQITQDYRSDQWYSGAFKYHGSNQYFYTLTVASVSNFKYEFQENINVVGRNASTGIAFSNPLSYTYIFLPQATYQIWVTRHKAGTWTSPPGPHQTYSLPAEGTLTAACLNHTPGGSITGGMETWNPFVGLSLSGGGTWVDGLPDNWPDPTVTHGTGDFQATLNWKNNNDRSSDLDLHLYGPNDIHIYYFHKTSTDGSLRLDRDWRGENGNAIENIYSTGAMPSGNYEIKVQLFSGDPTNFDVRIIDKENVENISGSLAEPKQEKVIYNFTIQ